MTLVRKAEISLDSYPARKAVHHQYTTMLCDFVSTSERIYGPRNAEVLTWNME